jgi:hypothetical protein
MASMDLKLEKKSAVLRWIKLNMFSHHFPDKKWEWAGDSPMILGTSRHPHFQTKPDDRSCCAHNSALLLS